MKNQKIVSLATAAVLAGVTGTAVQSQNQIVQAANTDKTATQVASTKSATENSVDQEKKQVVAATDEVDQITNNLKQANQDTKDAENELTTSKKQEETAATNFDQAQANKEAATETGIKQAEDQISTAKNKVTTQQKQVDMAEEEVKKNQEIVNEEKESGNTIDESSVSKNQISIDNLNQDLANATDTAVKAIDKVAAAQQKENQINQEIAQVKNVQEETQKVINDEQEKLNNIEYVIKNGNAPLQLPSELTADILLNGSSDEVTSILKKNKNTYQDYVTTVTDDNEKINSVEDITYDQYVRLSQFSLSIINQLREQFGQDPFKLTNGSVKFSTKVASVFNQGEFLSYDEYFKESRITSAPGVFYIYQAAAMGTLPATYAGITNDEFVNKDLSMGLLKKEIYSSLVKVITGELTKGSQEVLQGLLLPYTSVFEKGLQTSTKESYLGMSIDKFGELHFAILPIVVDQEQRITNDFIFETMDHDLAAGDEKDTFGFTDTNYQIPAFEKSLNNEQISNLRQQQQEKQKIIDVALKQVSEQTSQIEELTKKQNDAFSELDNAKNKVNLILEQISKDINDLKKLHNNIISNDQELSQSEAAIESIKLAEEIQTQIKSDLATMTETNANIGQMKQKLAIDQEKLTALRNEQVPLDDEYQEKQNEVDELQKNYSLLEKEYDQFVQEYNDAKNNLQQIEVNLNEADILKFKNLMEIWNKSESGDLSDQEYDRWFGTGEFYDEFYAAIKVRPNLVTWVSNGEPTSIIDINQITLEQLKNINIFAAGVINAIRKTIGVPPVAVSDASVAYGKYITDLYNDKNVNMNSSELSIDWDSLMELANNFDFSNYQNGSSISLDNNSIYEYMNLFESSEIELKQLEDNIFCQIITEPSFFEGVSSETQECISFGIDKFGVIHIRPILYSNQASAESSKDFYTIPDLTKGVSIEDVAAADYRVSTQQDKMDITKRKIKHVTESFDIAKTNKSVGDKRIDELASKVNNANQLITQAQENSKSLAAAIITGQKKLSNANEKLMNDINRENARYLALLKNLEESKRRAVIAATELNSAKQAVINAEQYLANLQNADENLAIAKEALVKAQDEVQAAQANYNAKVAIVDQTTVALKNAQLKLATAKQNLKEAKVKLAEEQALKQSVAEAAKKAEATKLAAAKAKSNNGNGVVQAATTNQSKLPQADENNNNAGWLALVGASVLSLFGLGTLNKKRRS